MTTAAVTVAATTTGLVGMASADHPPAEECRDWAPHPHPYVHIAAEDGRFDTHCLKAPANRRFRIFLRNYDTDPHNISIYTADPEQDEKAGQVFKGEEVKGRGSRSRYPLRADYPIGALPPGEYFFRCDKTPAMNGVLQVLDEED